MVREDILRRFPELFGTRTINGRTVNVEETIAALARQLGPDIAAALGARAALLQSTATVREKYAWPNWDDTCSVASFRPSWAVPRPDGRPYEAGLPLRLKLDDGKAVWLCDAHGVRVPVGSLSEAIERPPPDQPTNPN